MCGSKVQKMLIVLLIAVLVRMNTINVAASSHGSNAYVNGNDVLQTKPIYQRICSIWSRIATSFTECILACDSILSLRDQGRVSHPSTKSSNSKATC